MRSARNLQRKLWKQGVAIENGPSCVCYRCHLARGVIARVRQRVGPEMAIIGAGGTMCGADAVEKIRAGANAVQLYSGLIYRGPALVSECVRAIRAARS